MPIFTVSLYITICFPLDFYIRLSMASFNILKICFVSRYDLLNDINNLFLLYSPSGYTFPIDALK